MADNTYTPTAADFDRFNARSNDGYQPKLEDFQRFDQSRSGEMGSPMNPREAMSNLHLLAKGFKEGGSHQGRSMLNALGQIAGAPQLENPELGRVSSAHELLGRGAGEVGASLAGLAPFASAGSAIIPGVAGSAIGAGLGGLALTPGSLRDRASQAILDAFVPGTAKAIKTGGRLLKSGAFRKSPEDYAQMIEKTYDKQKDLAGGLYQNVLKKAKDEGVSRIKLPKYLMEEIKEIGPKTQAFKRALEKAAKGGYEELHHIQSSLFTRSHGLKKSQDITQRELGEDVGEVRTKLNDYIENHFDKSGTPELAHDLREARRRYRHLKDVFEKHPTINKLVGEEREVPENLGKFLQKNTTFHKNLMKEIPELEKAIKTQKDKDQLNKIIKGAKEWSVPALFTKYLLGNEKTFNQE